MKPVAALLVLGGASLFAQSGDTIYFRATMLPSNEVPAVAINARASATLLAHVIRDSSGQILSGTVDFNVSYLFPGPVTITGLHIHPGAAGVNGPVTISSGLGGANSIVDSTGSSGSPIARSGQVQPDDQNGLVTLRDMIDHPDQYYVNIHTTDNPGGVMRGQLQKADVTVFMALMSNNNEVPPVPMNASGVASVMAITTRDSSGAFTSGQLIFDVNYIFPQQVTFTGFHIHPAPAGVNGGVIFNTGIGGGPASVQSDPSGAGNIHRPVEIDLTSADQIAALKSLFANPAGLYINLHTTDFPGGVIRSQLHATDLMRFPVNMLPSNEVPPITGIVASAPAQVQVRTLRAEDGSVVAGWVLFDANYRFPSNATFTGMHIHNGTATDAGPVTISSGLSGGNTVVSDTGLGNIYRWVTVGDGQGLATLNSLVRGPENHYVNLHTTVNPGGVVRSQLAPANTAAPTILAAIGADQDKNATTFAPGELIAIYGNNLAKVGTDLTGWQGSTWPDLLNGVAAAVGGKRARMLYVSANQVIVQVAFDTPTGTQPLVVNNGNAPGPALNVNIAAVAPAIFFTSTGGIIAKGSDNSIVGPSNPAHAGDVVWVYATGLGQTTPGLVTGGIVPASPQFTTVPVSATIGGQNAAVGSSTATPYYVGLYQVAVTVPSGLIAGNQPLVLKVGSATSNTVSIAVQ